MKFNFGRKKGSEHGVKKTIKGKIQLLSMLLVGIALVTLGTVSSIMTYNSSVSILKETMSQTAGIAGARIQYQLDSIKNVAFETGSIARLSNAATSTDDKKKLIDQKVKTYNFQKGDVLDSSGKSIFDQTSYSDKDWYKTAMKGTATVASPNVDSKTKALTIIVAAPLWEGGNANTKVVGVVYYVTQESYLNDMVNSITVSPGSMSFLVNSSGTTIAHRNNEAVQNQENMIEVAKKDSAYKQLGDSVSQMIKGGAGFGQYPYGSDTWFIAYAPIGDTDGWSIAVNAPISDFLSSTKMAIFISIGVLGVSLIIAYFVSRRIAAQIANPIKLCVDRIALIAKGDLKSPLPQINAKDETGLLAKATEEHLHSLNIIIEDINYLITEIVRGNLNVRTRALDNYIGDFESVLLSLRTLVVELTNTMGHINSASDQVAAGAEQLASSATSLSQGATEQASSIEELAATISEISIQTNQNAKNAEVAGSEVETLGIELRGSNEQMERLINAMNDIGNASNEISKIIKAIEDIAFQTNILALNAAVEAARAGQAGKGFAVVADEVRNLAGKSAQAANSTTTLIESAIRAVNDGTRLVDETGVSLGKVVQRADHVVNTVKKISDASVTQAEAVNQVTMGVDQISGVIQMNSSAAEESAATSEELSSQSQLLKSLIAQFKLRVEK